MKQTNLSLKDTKILITSMFGIGFSPKAPGTMGSLLTLAILAFYDHWQAPKSFLIPFFVMLTVISSFLCQLIIDQYEITDPGWVVIDEFLGMLLGYFFFVQAGPIYLLIFFGLFRFFDILKPWPISLADKLKTGFGVILDDLIAGVFAGALTAFAQFLMGDLL